MAQKNRVVRRVDERNDNMVTGGGQLISAAPPVLAAIGAPDIPPPENITVGTQVLMRTTLVPKVLVSVSWDAPSSLLPDAYIVEYAEDVSFTSKVLRQTTTLESIALEMKPATDYWIRVEARIRGAYSGWGYPSNYAAASVTTIGDTTPPGPVVLNTTSWLTGDLEFVWTNPIDTNFFQTRVRIYDVAPGLGGTLYKEVYVVGNPGSKSRYAFTVADNEDVSAGAYLKTVYYELTAYSLAGVPTLTPVTGTVTKAPPSKPTGLADSWSGDDGTYDEGVIIAFNNQNYIKDYIVTIDGIAKRTASAQYVYPYSENVANHRPTLKSGDPNLSYTVQARDALNQVSPGASGTAVNIAPQSSNITLQTAPGFSSLYAYVTHTNEVKDINHYRWTLASGSGPVIRTVITTTPEITFTTLKGLYDLQVRAVDHFGQASNPVTASGLLLDGLTIQDLRANATYTDSVGNSPESLADLADGISNVQAVLYVGSTTVWKWTRQERALIDRYRTITAIAQNAAAPASIYFGLSTDGTTYRWFSGPLVSTGVIAGNTTLTEYASEALAQTNAILVTASSSGRFDLPAIIEARYIYMGHRRTTSNYNFGEFYGRRLVQSDDMEAESIKGINIAAASILADHISVTQLSAITANIGQLIIDTTGYIWQGTGTAASPTTGLKIDNSGGIGRLRTFNSGVVQISLDTDGRLKAGAGVVVLDEDGVAITGANFTYLLTNLSPVVVPTVNSIKWTETTAVTAAQVTGSLDGQLLLRGDRITLAYPIPSSDDNYGIDINGPSGSIYLRADSIAFGYDNLGSAVQITSSVSSGGSSVHTEGDISSDGGINIGTATGAATGQIRGSGYHMASDAGALPAYGVLAIGYVPATPRGLIVSIDSGAYQRLDIEASDLRLKYQSTTRILIDSVGLSFFNVATVARQTGGAATADLTWSANEVAMLNTLWTAMRNYGLLT